MADRDGNVRSYRFTNRWRTTVRQQAFAMWGARCYWCGWPGQDGKGKGLQLAHIHDHDMGGADEASNVRPACPRDHAIYDAGKRRARTPRSIP